MCEAEILKQLFKAGKILLEAHTEDAVLEQVVSLASGSGFHRVRLFLISEDGTHRLVTAAGEEKVDDSQAATGEARLHSQALLSDPRPRVLRYPEEEGEPTSAPAAREVLCAPLIHKNKIMGHLSADSPSGGDADHYLQLLVLFADQAAAAILTVRLLAEKDRKAKNLSGVLEIANRISSSLDLDAMLRATCRAAVELMGASHSGLALFDDNFLQGVVHAEFPDLGLMGRLIQLRGAPLEEHLIKTKEPLQIQDVSGAAGLGAVRDILLELKICSVLIVPVVSKGRVLGSFSLDAIGSARAFTSDEVELCKILASQLAVAIENSRLYRTARERVAQLDALHKATILISDQHDRSDLSLAITRHAVELLKARAGGIYEYQPELGTLSVIADFSRPSYVGKTLRLGEGIAGRLVQDGEPFMIIDDYNNWPGRASVYSSEHGFGAVLAVPLRRREHIIGVLYIDDEVGRRFTEEEACLLALFANTASIAIDNAGLIDKAESARQAFQSFLEASNTLVSAGKPKQVLNDISKQIIAAAGAASGSLILIDEAGQVRQSIKTGGPEKRVHKNIVRPGGVSLRVMRTGDPEVFGDLSNFADVVNPIMLEEEIAAALCLPLAWKGKRIGVMWLHYDEIRTFPDFELEALQLYLNQAAIAYDGARLMEEMDRMHSVVESLAAATDVPETLAKIAEGSKTLFAADSTAVFTYDDVRKRFIAEESYTCGIPAESWEEFLQVGLRPRTSSHGTAYTVLELGWVGVADVADEEEYEYVGDSTRHLLKRIGAQSFQGIALRDGAEQLGILYINYNRPVSFQDDHRDLAQAFAHQAALALKKAKLLERLNRSKSASKSVAEAIASKGLDETLRAIAAGTLTTLGCDAVVLFVYDARTQRLNHPPTMVGVLDEKKASEDTSVRRNSIVYKMLNRNDVYIAEDVGADPEFSPRRFAREEEIKSCVAIPLISGGGKVGVMFVNYRRTHQFVKDELDDIRLFANQAAVAIRNAQLAQLRDKKLAEQTTLVDLSRALLSAANLQEVLDRAVEFAAAELKTPFSNIVLPNADGELVFVAAKGWREGIEIGATKLERGKGSQTGYIIETREPSRVDDYTGKVPFQVPQVVFQNNIRSGMGVPMRDRAEVIGALLVHSQVKRHFTRDEVTFLSLIANQTAIAVKSAQQSEALNRQRHKIDTVMAAGAALGQRGGLPIKSVLVTILSQAVSSVIGSYDHENVFGNIWLYQAEKDELVCRCVYSAKEFPALEKREGCTIPLKSLEEGQEKIGIIGRTVRTCHPQVVKDVHADNDYREFDPNTKSELTMPLFDGDMLIGVLNIESGRQLIFDSDDPNILGILARLAAVAHGIGLQQQREETTKQYKLLAESSVAFASAKDEEEAILAVMQALEKSGFEDVLLSFYDAASGQIIGHTSWGAWEKAGEVTKLACELDDDDVRAEVLRTNKPIFVPDAREDARFSREAVEKAGVRAQLVIPLALEEEMIGTLQIAVADDLAAEMDKQFILQAFSNHLSLAISRIRNLLKSIELTDQVVAGSRFIVAETLAGMALHSLGHKLDDVTTKIQQDLEQREVRENRMLFKRLNTWLAELSAVEHDLREALQFVKSAGRETDFRETDLHPEVQRTIDMWINLIKTAKCVIRPHLEAHSSFCRIAPHAFREILSVLIVNSVQAHAKRIDIRTYNASGVPFLPHDIIANAFCLEFTDDGEGLSTNNTEEIFEPTYSTKHKKFGTGLGLFIARRLARKGGGYLQVAGAGISGKGVTFLLTLPCRKGEGKDVGR